MHDDWEDSRKQNIRKTAVDQSKELHMNIMKQVNKQKREEKEDNEPILTSSKDDIYTPSTEEIIEDADKIYKYIKDGEKGL